MHATHDETAQQLARIALGDRSAFAALYRSTSAHLFGLVCHVVRDAALAEEILQDVYVTVWRSAAGFDARQGQPMTWLNSIARHRAIDALRRRAARPATVSHFAAAPGQGGADDDEVDALERMRSSDPGPLEMLEEAARAHTLAHCMAALNGAQRSCLALAYYQGLSHAEVAEHLRQPLGTVKSWLRRALQSLRDCLDRVAAPTRGGTC